MLDTSSARPELVAGTSEGAIVFREYPLLTPTASNQVLWRETDLPKVPISKGLRIRILAFIQPSHSGANDALRKLAVILTASSKKRIKVIQQSRQKETRQSANIPQALEGFPLHKRVYSDRHAYH